MKTIYSKATSEFCKLCLMEKLYILNALGDERCLNKRTEFISKCRHQNKLLLKNVKYTLLGLNFADGFIPRIVYFQIFRGFRVWGYRIFEEFCGLIYIVFLLLKQVGILVVK